MALGTIGAALDSKSRGRAAIWIGLCNPCYNLRRFAFLQTAAASAG